MSRLSPNKDTNIYLQIEGKRRSKEAYKDCYYYLYINARLEIELQFGVIRTGVKIRLRIAAFVET